METIAEQIRIHDSEMRTHDQAMRQHEPLGDASRHNQLKLKHEAISGDTKIRGKKISDAMGRHEDLIKRNPDVSLCRMPEKFHDGPRLGRRSPTTQVTTILGTTKKIVHERPGSQRLCHPRFVNCRRTGWITRAAGLRRKENGQSSRRYFAGCNCTSPTFMACAWLADSSYAHGPTKPSKFSRSSVCSSGS